MGIISKKHLCSTEIPVPYSGTAIGVPGSISTTIKSRRLIGSGLDFLSVSETRKGLVSMVDQAIVSASNFITGIIIGRACSKEELGLYSLGFSIIIVALNLQTSIISSPYTTYMPRLKSKALSLYTGSSLIHQIGLSLFVFTCLVTLRLTLSEDTGPNGLLAVLWALAPMIAFIMLREYARRVCFAHLLMRTVLIIDSSVVILQTVALFLFAYFGLLSTVRTYFIIGLSCAIASLFWLIRYRKSFSFSPIHVVQDFTGNWALGKWLLPGRALSLVGILVYPWLITIYQGTAATGSFAACQGAIGICTFILLGSGNILYPITARSFSQGGPDQLRSTFKRIMAIYALFFSLLSVFLLLCGGWLVELIYGSKYSDLSSLASILALSQFFLALMIPLEATLVAMERPANTFWGHFFGFTLSITLGVGLTIYFGAHGAALGLAIYYFTTGFFFLFGLKIHLFSS